MTKKNIEALMALHGWLLNGAQHTVFDMNQGATEVEEYISDSETTPEKLSEAEDYLNENGCGTVCCIAGAAMLMNRAKEEGITSLFPSPEQQREFSVEDWELLRDEALRFLGLERAGVPEKHDEDSDKTDGKLNISWFGHELFSPDLCPKDCTPQQAAQAVMNVINDKPAWDDV